jgi:hypothetical protein
MAETTMERRSRELERKEAPCIQTDAVDTSPAFRVMAGLGRHEIRKAHPPRPTGAWCRTGRSPSVRTGTSLCPTQRGAGTRRAHCRS